MTPIEKLTAIRALSALAWADGQITDEEEAHLVEFMVEFVELGREEVTQVLEEVRSLDERTTRGLQAMDAASNSSFGVGYVNFYNPNTDSLEAAGRLGVYDNSPNTANLILSGGSIEAGVNPQFLGLGDDEGDVHDHLIVDLLDDDTAAFGAYGVLFRLQSDFDVADGNMDLASDPFWIIWNYGMDEEDFDELALPKFGAVEAVPEPSTLGMFAIGMAAIMVRRRRS